MNDTIIGIGIVFIICTIFIISYIQENKVYNEITNKLNRIYEQNNKMQRKITRLPDDLNPVKIINHKMMTCPLCGTLNNGKLYGGYNSSYRLQYADINGVVHKFFKKKNKYQWGRYTKLLCENCGCGWDTGWYPVDNKMFEIPINIDKK